MQLIGKEYHVKGSQGFEKTMAITGENEGDLTVHISTNSPYGILESDEQLSRELFESCLRTGYLTEINSHALTCA